MSLSMSQIELIYVSKRGHWCVWLNYPIDADEIGMFKYTKKVLIVLWTM